MLGGIRAREPSLPEPTPDPEAKPSDEPVESPPQLVPMISEGAAPIATFGIVDGATLGPLLPKARMIVLATVLMMTVFVETAGSTAPTLLIPLMARDLDIPEIETQWVSSAYIIASSCGKLFSGRMADIWGRKRMFLIGLAIYAVFAIITGAVKVRVNRRERLIRENIVVISVTRALSGIGNSIAIPAGFGLIGATIKQEPARTIVFSMFGLGSPVGSAVGNFIGGAMGSIGPGAWSYLFFLLAGLSVITFVAAIVVIPSDVRVSTDQDTRIDWVGGALVTSAMCLFTFSLADSGLAPKGWRTPYVPALLVTSLLVLLAFVLWSVRLERRTPASTPPILKMSLLSRKSGLISVVCGNCFLVSISVMGWVYTSTIFYQNYKGLTTLQNAIAILPSTIVGALAAMSVMYLAPRVSARHLMTLGAAFTRYIPHRASADHSVCSILYATWPVGLTYWAMEFPGQVLLPWGIDLTFVLGNILISNLVEAEDQSVAGALFQTSGALGSALGICITALIVGQVGQQAGDVLRGCRAGFWFGAGASLVVSASAYIGFRKVGLAKDVGKIR